MPLSFKKVYMLSTTKFHNTDRFAFTILLSKAYTYLVALSLEKYVEQGTESGRFKAAILRRPSNG